MLTSREEKRQLWIERIEPQRSSGPCITEFCKLRRQLHAASFYNWRRKLPPPQPQHGNFVAVELEPTTILRLRHPEGCSLELNDHISQDPIGPDLRGGYLRFQVTSVKRPSTQCLLVRARLASLSNPKQPKCVSVNLRLKQYRSFAL